MFSWYCPELQKLSTIHATTIRSNCCLSAVQINPAIMKSTRKTEKIRWENFVVEYKTVQWGNHWRTTHYCTYFGSLHSWALYATQRFVADSKFSKSHLGRVRDLLFTNRAPRTAWRIVSLLRQSVLSRKGYRIYLNLTCTPFARVHNKHAPKCSGNKLWAYLWGPAGSLQQPSPIAFCVTSGSRHWACKDNATELCLVRK